jgi:hypothetical protein
MTWINKTPRTYKTTPTPFFTIVEEWLDDYMFGTKLDRHQCKAIGIEYPPTNSKWKVRVIGKRITDQQRFEYELFYRMSALKKMHEDIKRSVGSVDDGIHDEKPFEAPRADDVKLTHDEVEYAVTKSSIKAWGADTLDTKSDEQAMKEYCDNIIEQNLPREEVRFLRNIMNDKDEGVLF